MELNKGEVAVAGLAIAGTALLLSTQTSSASSSKKYVLVFEDIGEETTCGLAPNAVSVFYNPGSVDAKSLRSAAGTALQVDRPNAVRLWVQATKEEVSHNNLKSVLQNTHGLSAVVLIGTKEGKTLSASAGSSKALQRFPAGPTPLPVLGNALAMARGPGEIPALNSYANLFRGKKEKTLLIQLPLMDYDGHQEKIYGIDYNPLKSDGLIITSDCEMIEEMLKNQEYFPKMFNLPKARGVQEFVHKGMFTDDTTSKVWETGHGVLPKFFNALRIKNYFPVVRDKTQVFVREWCKLGNGVTITDVNDWITCMTADAVTKASMDFDMNNVQKKGAKEELHPFIKNFRFGLGYATGHVTAKTVYGKFNAMNPLFGANAKMKKKFVEAKEVCTEIVNDLTERTRKGEIGGPSSLITAMLEAKASTNKEFVQFADFYGHIMNLMIAGHETTAATLGFCMAELARHPDCLAKAVAEIESVMGDRVTPTYEDITSLPYVDACFNEVLRMYPAVQQILRDSAEDRIVKGNHLIRKGQRIMINNYGVNRDPEQWDQGVFGDVDKYNPDRHLADAPKRHANSLNSFGFGVRACMGNQFAILEARTFLCMMLNFFTFELPPGFELKPSTHDGGAAPSPKDLTLTIRFRPGGPIDRINMFEEGPSKPLKTSSGEPSSTSAPSLKASVKTSKTPLLILYGSNSGTCEDFAADLEATATGEGYVVEKMTLDMAEKEGKMPYTKGAVAIVACTYNGFPPDNAKNFSKWLDAAPNGSQAGVQYAVFGVGNTNWVQTYQHFPKKIHEGLAGVGATQLMELHIVDVDTAGFVEVFEDWTTSFMGVLSLNFGGVSNDTVKTGGKMKQSYLVEHNPATSCGETFTSAFSLVKFVKNKADEIIGESKDEKLMKFCEEKKLWSACEVTKATQLQSEISNRSTCHVEMQLPPGLTYQAGDHLEVLGNNSDKLIDEALNILGLTGREAVEIVPHLTSFNKGFPSHYPNKTITVTLALKWLADLSAPPSRKTLLRVADSCPCPPEANQIRALADENHYAKNVLDVGLTLTELLKKFRSVSMDIVQFCESHPRLKPRYYSISSSPLVKSTRVAITVGLVEYKTKTGRDHVGAASGEINSLTVGNELICKVTCLNSKFKLPKDPTKPVIMVGPGTGVAPMMGFLEERDVLLKKGTKLGPAHLFFGCRASNTDYIYKELLESYEKSGVLSSKGLHVAFSREKDNAKVYVQDLISENGKEMWELIEGGACIYICGDAKRMAPDVKKVFLRVAMKYGVMTESAADNWMAGLMEGGRYLEDVYA